MFRGCPTHGLGALKAGTYKYDPYGHPHFIQVGGLGCPGKPSCTCGCKAVGNYMGAEPQQLTLSQAVSGGYVALARLAVLANIYLIASAGQAVANKVFRFDGKLLENPLTGPETSAAIAIAKWATITGPRLLSESLAKNDIHRFKQVQAKTKNFADMIFSEVPKTYKDNALYRFFVEVPIQTIKDTGTPEVWPTWLKVAVGVGALAAGASIYRDVVGNK